MALSNRSELIAAIGRWAWRAGVENETDDATFVAAIPDFITLLENRVNRELRVGEMLTTAPIVLTDGLGALPDDYLQYRRLSADTYPRWELNYGGQNEGRGFTISGSAITGWPITIGNLSMEYYAKIPALTEANPTNWLLTKAPEVYLYGSLLEAMPFTGDDQRAGTWHAYYDKAIGGLQSADVMARYAKAGRRSTGPTP